MESLRDDISTSPSPDSAANPRAAASRSTTTASEQQQQQQTQRRRTSGLLGNLRKGYQVLHDLLSLKPNNNLRSQVPYKSPRFADANAGWRLALTWLDRVSRRMRIGELLTPVFDRHGGFDRLELRRPSPPQAHQCTDQVHGAAAAAGGKRNRQHQLELQETQQLRERILRITGSGDLLRAISERLLVPDDSGDNSGDWGDGVNDPPAGRKPRGEAPAPRLGLLQLPLSFETTAGHQHRSGPPHLGVHLHVNHHHHHHNPHLQPDAQAGLTCCEENFAAFHRFLARVLTCPDSPGSKESGAGWELRVCLGKQCAECSAVGLLLHPAQQPQAPLDTALSVLLLHLLTLMMLLEEPLTQKQRSEVLQLWENRLEPEVICSSAAVKEMRRRYAQLMA